MKEKWDLIVKPHKNLFQIELAEIWRYRDLLTMFVRRDVVTVYKQTVLGPIWFLVQPVLTTFVFVLVFGQIAGISTDNIPQPLFYLAGIVIWNYFSECFTQTSDTFSQNQEMFGKVYFPRLIMPLSKVISGIIKFFIQFALFFAVLVYYSLNGFNFSLNFSILLFPFFIFLMAGLGLGFGLIFTSLTIKYRDLKFLIQFGVQLLMYATPIIYPISTIEGNLKTIVYLNPLTHVVEGFKYILLGQGYFELNGILYSTCCTFFFLFLGILIFSKTERSFMDTV